MAFELVYTVWDYWDGPRSGIASYDGQPHHYSCEWDEGAGDYADTFVLTAIDEETFALAMEQWSIWKKWETEFHRGKMTADSHPALPGSDQQYLDLQQRIETRLGIARGTRKRVRATFRVRHRHPETPKGVMRDLEVCWEEAPC